MDNEYKWFSVSIEGKYESNVVDKLISFIRDNSLDGHVIIGQEEEVLAHQELRDGVVVAYLELDQ